MSSPPLDTDAPVATLREVVEALAPLERRAGSEGERQAAEWIAERLAAAGCDRVAVEEERYRDGYAKLIAGLAGSAAVAGALFGRRLRPLATAVAAAATVAIADDASNGFRFARRLCAQERTTWNVVAEAGDPAAERTLAIIAHHDAAPTGFIFDERLQHEFGRRFPGILERIDTSLPLWWAALAPPALVAAGAASGRRGMLRAGIAGSALAAAIFGDIARSPVVPGANDNLTAVATLVALAERLRSEPLSGLRVLLVSVGAEEVLQGGIYGFVRRHLEPLDREQTWALVLDTLGSPQLILLEGEGPVVMEDYWDRRFRDLVASAAEHADAPLRRGMRSRNSTDAVIPSRAGIPTALLTSMDRYKALSNYHQMSDTPENVDYDTVLHALTVTEAVARRLTRAPRA